MPFTKRKKNAWVSFKNVTQNFLGRKRATNYEGLVQEMINAYRDLGCNMSLKVHFLNSHLNFFLRAVAMFPTNMVKGSIKILCSWKSVMKGNGCLQCLLTTAGTSFESAKLFTGEKNKLQYIAFHYSQNRHENRTRLPITRKLCLTHKNELQI